MAEFVEKRLEEQIPEIEAMERIGLLTKEDIRGLIQKRRHHEYKLGAPGCCRSDYIKALNYEAILLEYLDAQRQDIRVFEKREQIEFPIILRLLGLLTRVTRKYFFDLSLWDMRINFAINVRKLSKARSSFIEMTKKHGSLLSVWVKWAQFELDTTKDFQKAQEVLLSKASCYHSKNVVLQRELFRCKLLHMEFTFHKKLEDLRTKNSCKDVSSSLVLDDGEKLVFSGMEARVIYTKVVATHFQFNVAKHFYDIATKFPFAKYIREEIYRDIIHRFGSTPDGLIFKAERRALGLPVEEGDEETMVDCFQPKEEEGVEEHLRPYTIFCQSEKQSNGKKKALPVTTSDRKDTIERYLGLLDTGFEKFASESSDVFCRFCKLYVEQLLSLLYHCWGCPYSRTLIASRLSQRCAENLKLLPVELLLKWAVLLDHLPHADESKQWTGDAVVRAASELHPDHQPVLVQHLQRLVADDSVKNDTLLTAYAKMEPRLKDDWLRLAHHTICTGFRVYSKDDSDEAATKKKRDDLLCRLYFYDVVLSVNARLAMLQIAYKEKGLAGAREVYSEYCDRVPFSEAYQASMVLMELLGDPNTEEELKDGGTEKATVQKTKFVLDTNGVDAEEHESGDNEDKVEVEEVEGSEKETDSEEEIDQQESDADSGEEVDQQESDTDSEDEEAVEEEGDMKNMKAVPAIMKQPDMKRVRAIFELNIRQRGGKHHDMWLVYILLERRFAGKEFLNRRLYQRAVEKMEGWSVQAYTDMSIDIRDKRFMSPEEITEEAIGPAANRLKKSSIEKPIKLELLNRLSRGYFPRPGRKDDTSRVGLYKHLTKIEHFLTTPESPDSERVSWYDLLTTVLGGNRVRPVLHPSLTKDQNSVKKQLEPIKRSELSDLFKPGNIFNSMRRKEAEVAFQSSDKLRVSDSEERPEALALLRRQQLHCPAGPRDDIDAMLATSKILDPNFLKMKTLPRELSKKAAAKIAKKKRAKTAGKGWDYMEAPEMTPDVEKSIELLKMRGIMNPKQKFKTSHLKETPKYFQMGTVVGNPTDFYNRLTKKQRKSTIAEEIMNDHEAVRYQKRKYAELVARKESMRFRKRRKTTGADYIQVKM